MRATSWIFALTSLLFASSAAAQTYADPPDGHRRYDDVGSTVAYHPVDPVDPPDDGYALQAWRRRELSVFRFHVGGAGRILEDEVTPGLTTALDIGRGPAGFRATGTWLQVGSDQGVAQYTGELTLDLGGRHSWRPVVGAGAGLARFYEEQPDGDGTDAKSLGIGLLRVAIEYRIPVEATDTRAGLGVIGVLPAIRADDAPDPAPWIVVAATVGVGF